MSDALRNISIDHIRLYAADAAATAADLVQRYGFREVARDPVGSAVAVGQGEIVLVLADAATGEDWATGYVQSHGAGVADIALRTSDARAAFAEAVANGARPVREPVAGAGCVTATVEAFGDVVHTFVERTTAADDRLPPGLARTEPLPHGPAGLARVDHLAVCLPPGMLEPTVSYYESALGFTMIYQEQIVVGVQAMNSQVVRSTSGDVTLTLIEPDTSREPGQIDTFLKAHDGPGVQHIAMSTPDIVQSVRSLRERGVEFLSSPAMYYTRLARRLTPVAHAAADLRELSILVDSDQYGQLYQIFTRSTHPRGTFFFEVIERAGAHSFGSGNIKALYEAVELESRR